MKLHHLRARLHQASASTLRQLDDSAMTLQNGVATHFQASPLISMRTESLASSQSCRSVDVDAWCKQALTDNITS